jgi:hypothetical protein
MRIPKYVLDSLVKDMELNPDKDYWLFTTNGGQVLEVKRVKGPHCVVGAGDGSEDYGLPFDSLDFEYNPGD